MLRSTRSLAAKVGGRTDARRLFVALAMIVGGLTQLAPVRTMAQEPQPYVIVREERGVYSVTARFHVPQPSTVVLAVLTDYEGIPRFMPDVNTSVVLERADGWAVVQQEAVSKVLLFSKRVHLVLEVQEDLGTIRFRDRCGKSFDRYEGAWTITEQDGQSVVAYELTAKPSFDVPGFMLKRLLRSDSTEMIERLRREIATRTTSRSPVPDPSHR